MAQTSYGIFEVETFEMGTGLWHARVLRCDRQPLIFGGEPFEFLHIGLSWPSAQAALEDAQSFIDRIISPPSPSA